MRFMSLRVGLFAAVTSSSIWDPFLDAWDDIGRAHVELAWARGWRPRAGVELEYMKGLMREGSLAADAPLIEHAGSIDG